MSTITCKSVSIQVEDYSLKLQQQTSPKIFKIDILDYYNIVDWLFNFLTKSEQIHAKKYHFEKDTNRFIICRALLKFILAHHTNQSISDTIISVDENGKPYLASHEHVHFNLSHSDKCAIIAIDGNPIGVDIEFLNYNFDFTEVLSYSFGKIEQRRIAKSSDSTKMFFKFWTRKEAIVKMTGKGIDDYLSELLVLEGTNTYYEGFFQNLNGVDVISFDLDNEHIASIARTHEWSNESDLLIYKLPKLKESLELLIG